MLSRGRGLSTRLKSYLLVWTKQAWVQNARSEVPNFPKRPLRQCCGQSPNHAMQCRSSLVHGIANLEEKGKERKGNGDIKVSKGYAHRFTVPQLQKPQQQ